MDSWIDNSIDASGAQIAKKKISKKTHYDNDVFVLSERRRGSIARRVRLSRGGVYNSTREKPFLFRFLRVFTLKSGLYRARVSPSFARARAFVDLYSHLCALKGDSRQVRFPELKESQLTLLVSLIVGCSYFLHLYH